MASFNFSSIILLLNLDYEKRKLRRKKVFREKFLTAIYKFMTTLLPTGCGGGTNTTNSTNSSTTTSRHHHKRNEKTTNWLHFIYKHIFKHLLRLQTNRIENALIEQTFDNCIRIHKWCRRLVIAFYILSETVLCFGETSAGKMYRKCVWVQFERN